jgi:hypothetical protein
MCENRPGTQQAEALVQVALRLELREEFPRKFDLLFSLVEVCLYGNVSVGRGYLAKAFEKFWATAYSEPWCQHRLHKIFVVVLQSSNVFDASFGLVQRDLCRLISDRVRRIAVHVALADQRALPFSQAYISKYASRFSMAGAVVASSRNALADEPVDAALVRFSSIFGISEPSFVRKRDLLQPVQNMKTLSQTAHRPLWCVVVSVDEAWYQEVARWDATHLSIAGQFTLLKIRRRLVECSDSAVHVNYERSVWEYLECVQIRGVDDSPLEDSRCVGRHV